MTRDDVLVDGEPPRKQATVEFVNIPEDYTNVPYLKNVIIMNNKEEHARKRLSKGAALYSEGIRRAVKDRDLDAAVAMAKEAAEEKQLTLKTASTIAPLLHALWRAGNFKEGEELYDALMACAAKQPSNTEMFDDAVTTVAIRILNARQAPVSRFKTLIEVLPKDFIKRRLLFELLDVGLLRTDTALTKAVLTMADANEVELWDCDYDKAIETLVAASRLDQWPAEAWTTLGEAITHIMEHMQRNHPVVGAHIAEMLESLGRNGNSKGCIDASSGQCSNCGHTLHGFTLTDGEFSQLSDDIINKLIMPAMEKRSHYDTTKAIVGGEELAWRKAHFGRFAKRIIDDTFDVVIDGANVGYYGVTNWYSKAKRDLLLRLGRSDVSITPKEVSHMPLPVDVCPNFESVQSVLELVKGLGRTARIILHERHSTPSQRLYGRNEELLSMWRKEGYLIESPPYLNDDYCWLYACIQKKECMIVSNDLMRDHHFQMLSQRSFVRWRQRHRITFKIGHRGVVIHTPAPYSTWVQNAPSSNVWHIPFMHSAVLEQATNKKKPAAALEKDGDDECSGWLCVTL